LASTYNPTTFCLLKKQGYVCFHHDKFYWKFLEISHEWRIINLSTPWRKVKNILDSIAKKTQLPIIISYPQSWTQVFCSYM
jgi:hypothetical protein